jgi:hypothetical protein
MHTDCMMKVASGPFCHQFCCQQVFRDQGLIYMVLEYGDIDLARLLHNHEESKRAALLMSESVVPGDGDESSRVAAGTCSASGIGMKNNAIGTGGEDAASGVVSSSEQQQQQQQAAGRIDKNFVRLYWQQMLQVMM